MPPTKVREYDEAQAWQRRSARRKVHLALLQTPMPTTSIPALHALNCCCFLNVCFQDATASWTTAQTQRDRDVRSPPANETKTVTDRGRMKTDRRRRLVRPNRSASLYTTHT